MGTFNRGYGIESFRGNVHSCVASLRFRNDDVAATRGADSVLASDCRCTIWFSGSAKQFRGCRISVVTVRLHGPTAQRDNALTSKCDTTPFPSYPSVLLMFSAVFNRRCIWHAVVFHRSAARDRCNFSPEVKASSRKLAVAFFAIATIFLLSQRLCILSEVVISYCQSARKIRLEKKSFKVTYSTGLPLFLPFLRFF